MEEDIVEEAYASMAWTANGGWTASSAIPKKKRTSSREKEEERSNNEGGVDTEQTAVTRKEATVTSITPKKNW